VFLYPSHQVSFGLSNPQNVGGVAGVDVVALQYSTTSILSQTSGVFKKLYVRVVTYGHGCRYLDMDIYSMSSSLLFKVDCVLHVFCKTSYSYTMSIVASSYR
jgi:hypothetical protein